MTLFSLSPQGSPEKARWVPTVEMREDAVWFHRPRHFFSTPSGRIKFSDKSCAASNILLILLGIYGWHSDTARASFTQTSGLADGDFTPIRASWEDRVGIEASAMVLGRRSGLESDGGETAAPP